MNRSVDFGRMHSCRQTVRENIEGRPVSGFSLVVTVAMLVILLLLAVGLLSLASVEFRSSSQNSAMVQAQANARMALMMAIDELQQAMGPDARISARAELFANDPRVGLTVPANTPKAWWVGVSPSNIGDSSNPSPVVWLVSGLDPTANARDQLASTFEEPVIMCDESSINTSLLTGGDPIVAGKVNVASAAGGLPGGIAWIIDDNGMKAQLAATRPDVHNAQSNPKGGGILPGTYDLGILAGMNDLAGSSPSEINRLMSLKDLAFLGADVSTSRDKHFSYTTRSRGVLSDVKQGGLKKDLTIAFENENVFSSVFGDGEGYPAEYIMIDPAKFAECQDLQENGYIHWEMLKDFYNIKRSIDVDAQGVEFLPISVFSSQGVGWTGGDGRDQPNYKRGLLGPHQMGPNPQTPPEARPLPYGDYCRLVTNRGEAILMPLDDYKHSPVVPVMQRMQQNAWLEKIDIGGEPHVRTNVQIWFAQYNPYNIGLYNKSPMVRGYSSLNFDHKGLRVERLDHLDRSHIEWMTRWYVGFLGRAQQTVSEPVMLMPGRSHVYAMQADANNRTDSRGGYYDHGLFGDKVKDLTMESAQNEYRLFEDESHADELSYIFDIREYGTLNHGGTSGAFTTHLGSPMRFWTISQRMWAPYSWDRIGFKQISFDNVGLDELNENTMGKFSFSLRTTKEPASGAGPAIRPLVDANIRAFLANGRWDSPLGLNLLAAYSQDGEGEVDEQIMQMDISDSPKGYAYWGGGRDPIDGYHRVILFDIPRQDLVSLGQLQHANVGRFSYEPTYVIGNSYANLRIPRDQWRASVVDTLSTRMNARHGSIQGNFNLYDASYLANEALWDSYIFTTIPQVADNRDSDSEVEPNAEHFEQLRAGEALLPNPRFIPYEPRGSVFAVETLQEDDGAFDHNAGHLMVDGAFNVNSTSVDAWEAFLSGTHQLPYQKVDDNGTINGFETDIEGVRFPRVHASHGGPMSRDSMDENYWTGFRSLDQEEVRVLAEAIVDQVKQRGPFLSLGEFVNRKLEDSELGQSGALQAALDATVNKDLDSSFEADSNHPDIPSEISQGSGFPGQLFQGDVLQALSPYMTVRSDTFTIRAYGEVQSPKDGSVMARAWCEVTVQRYPDPVPGGGGDFLDELANPSSPFGRKFEVVSFRWLHPDEI